MPTCTLAPMASHLKHRVIREACFDDSTDILTSNTDDFIIGDRVFVNGTKPGYIQYIGETQFAPGEWAGVVLDEPVGKNDGSISGVRYFQCEPKRGVFARLHRITRLPFANGVSGTTHHYGDKTIVSSTQLSSTPSSPASSIKSSLTSPRAGSVITTATTTMTSVPGGLRVGDRVMVNATSGVKMGWLRYLGTAEFATGNWAGVELDEPIGKNDGSVAGKRYFDCRMKFGLFAPLHKISKMPSGRNSVTTTTSRVVTPVQQGGLHRRSGSHESLNSSLSSASSLARAGRVRLGVKALATNTQKPTRATPVNTAAATHTALQDTLKEKEEHIEQLLKERDLERSEVARAAAQVEETEQKLAIIQAGKARFLDDMEASRAALRDQLESLELEKTELALLLEDERKKVEDLQFRVEEESITRSDLENQAQEDSKKIVELEQQLKEDQLKTSTIAQDSEKVTEADMILNTYKDSVEGLSKKVFSLEETVKAMAAKEAEYSSKVGTLESKLLSKEDLVLQLESSLETRRLELTGLQQRLSEMDEELKTSKGKQEKQLQVIDGLNLKLTKSESSSSGLNEELQTAKLSTADIERQAKTTEERCEQLTQQKAKLEQQIAEMMQSTGDNSQALTQMNNDLRQKEKLLDEKEALVRSVTQDLERHKDLLEVAKKNTADETQRLTEENLANKNMLQKSLEEKSKELDQLKGLVKTLELKHQEQEDTLKSKATILEELQKRIHKEEAESTMVKVSLQEAQLKLEGISLNTSQATKQAEESLQQLRVQNEALQKEKEQTLTQQVKIEETHNQLRQENDLLQKEKVSQEKTVKDREEQVVALQVETQRLRQEFAEHKEELQKQLKETQLDSQSMQEIQNQWKVQQEAVKEFQALLEESEAEKMKIFEELKSTKKTYEERITLEKDSSEKFRKQVEEINERNSSILTQLEQEKASLQKELEVAAARSQEDGKKVKLLEQKMSESLSASIKETSGKEEELGRFKSSCQKLEDDKRQLENKVVQLQVTLAKSNTQNNSDPEIQKLQEEKDALDAQIEFLNSVIVDMQRKNDELSTKVTNLETEGEFLDATDLNLNGIRTVRPPRLFCDICDCFDLHDTEDCPTQCSVVEELVTHSHHGGKRNEERPYCDSCEVFGHWTKNCDDGETF